jgi:hypothetical protein
MASRREILKWSLGALVGAAPGVPPALGAEGANALVIVVAKQSTIQGLSRFELKRLYLGARIEDAGERIIPFNQAPNSADRVAFEARVLDMAADEAARYWIDRKIRGESGAPKAISPVDLLQRVVSRLPHSLAYVRLPQVLPEVRPIAIDGRLPGDAAYKLFV